MRACGNKLFFDGNGANHIRRGDRVASCGAGDSGALRASSWNDFWACFADGWIWCLTLLQQSGSRAATDDTVFPRGNTVWSFSQLFAVLQAPVTFQQLAFFMAASRAGWGCASSTNDALFPGGNTAWSYGRHSDSLARSWAQAVLTRQVEDAGAVPLGCTK